MAGPGGKDRRGVLIAAVGVRDGDRAELRGLLGKVRRARQLRRHVHDAHQSLAGLVQRAERLEVRQAEVRAVLRALFLLGEERPLHLDANQAGTAGVFCTVIVRRRAERAREHVIRQRHRRGSERRDTVLCQIARHRPDAVRVAVGKIRAGVAVVVDINQAGDHACAAKIRARRVGTLRQDLAEPPVLDGECAADKALRRENFCMFKQHREPPADWPRPSTGRRGGISHPAA